MRSHFYLPIICRILLSWINLPQTPCVHQCTSRSTSPASRCIIDEVGRNVCFPAPSIVFPREVTGKLEDMDCVMILKASLWLANVSQTVVLLMDKHLNKWSTKIFYISQEWSYYMTASTGFIFTFGNLSCVRCRCWK